MTQTNFGGDPHCYKGSADLWRETQSVNNDRFQSVKIPNGLQVVVLGDDAYHGYSTLLTWDQRGSRIPFLP